jgi:hypothetical protein
MQKNKEDILGWAIFIGLISHFLFGYFFWDKIGTEKLYTITVYFVIDVLGLVSIILSTKKLLTNVGYLAMFLGTFYFYMEFNDPYNFQVKNFRAQATLGVSFMNLFFLWYYTDLFKKLKR